MRRRIVLAITLTWLIRDLVLGLQQGQRATMLDFSGRLQLMQGTNHEWTSQPY